MDPWGGGREMHGAGEYDDGSVFGSICLGQGFVVCVERESGLFIGTPLHKNGQGIAGLGFKV